MLRLTKLELIVKRETSKFLNKTVSNNTVKVVNNQEVRTFTWDGFSNDPAFLLAAVDGVRNNLVNIQNLNHIMVFTRPSKSRNQTQCICVSCYK